MKISVSRVHCLSAVKQITALISGKPRVGKKDEDKPKGPLWQIDRMIRLRVTSDGLQVFGGSREGFAQVALPGLQGEVLQSGEVLIYPQRLAEMLSLGRGDKVTFGFTMNDELAVKMEGAQYTIDFPTDGELLLQVPSGLVPIGKVYSSPLRSAMLRTLFATGEDEENATFSHDLVCFEFTPDCNCALMASDGTNLSIAAIQDIERLDVVNATPPEVRLGVPPKSVSRLRSMVGEELEAVTVVTDNRLVGFRFKSAGLQVEFYSPLIAKKIPSYRRAIPDTGSRSHFTVRADELGMAARACIPFTGDTGFHVVMTADKFCFDSIKREVGSVTMSISSTGAEGSKAEMRLSARMLAKFAEGALIDPTPIDVYVGGETEPVLFRSGEWTFVTGQCHDNPAPVEKPKSKGKKAATTEAVAK